MNKKSWIVTTYVLLVLSILMIVWSANEIVKATQIGKALYWGIIMVWNIVLLRTNVKNLFDLLHP